MLPSYLHIFVSDHLRSIPKIEFSEFLDFFLRITNVSTKGKSLTKNLSKSTRNIVWLYQGYMSFSLLVLKRITGKRKTDRLVTFTVAAEIQSPKSSLISEFCTNLYS